MSLARTARRNARTPKAEEYPGAPAGCKIAGIAQVARAVRRGVIVGTLRTSKHDGLCTATENLQRQRGLFHRVGAMGDDYTVDVLPRRLGINHRDELIEVRQSDRGGVELPKLHYLGVDIGG